MRIIKTILSISLICSISILFLSCAKQGPMRSVKSQKKTTIKNSTNLTGSSAYEQLQVLHNSREYEKYLQESSGFITAYPNSGYLDRVYNQRGLLLLGMKRYQEASEELKKASDFGPSSSVYVSSNYYYALSEYKNNNPDSSINAIKEIEENKTQDNDLYVKSQILKSNIQMEKGDRKAALKSLADLYRETNDLELKSKIKLNSLSIIDKMDLSELKSVEGEYTDTGLADAIIFKLGEKYFESDSAGAARERFNDLLSTFPESEYRSQAENYLARLEGLDKADPFTIGVVLPLTGKNSAYGLKTLSGIQLGVGVFGPQRTKSIIKLSVMDSQSDPGVAKMAVDKLLNEDKVSAIIGPLGGDETEVVSKQCTLAGVPNITLSNKDNIEGLGKYVFRMSMTNKSQISRLVDYAMNDIGIKRFGILYPNDNYGQELSKYFWEEVLRRGGEIRAVEYYEPGKSDFRDEVMKLFDIYYVGARLPEYKEIEKAIEEEEAQLIAEGKKPSKRKKEVSLPPIIDFEGLFIPDDARVGSQIAPYLPYYDVKDVTLLGTNTWNSQRLVARGGEHIDGAIFVDGFYSNPSFKEGNSFYHEFKTAFNSSPGILEAQGYDAGRLIAKAIDELTDGGKKKEQVNRESVRKELLSIGSFTGATGKISFDKNGEVQKELFVLGVDKGKIILKE